jgi:hypothetical protein
MYQDSKYFQAVNLSPLVQRSTQCSESRRRPSEQACRGIELDDFPGLQHGNLVVAAAHILEPVHDREDRVRDEVAVDDALHDGLRVQIDAVACQYL